MRVRRVPAADVRVESAAVPARIALLGTGNVGRAVLERLGHWSGPPSYETHWAAAPRSARLLLVHAANSRFAIGNCTGLPPHRVEHLLGDGAQPGGLDAVARSLGDEGWPVGRRGGARRRQDGERIVIDATASAEVADRHAAWLAKGIHVVTACKIGQGTSLSRWQAIRSARERGGSQYGDGATVGAGLPLLRSVRELRAGGDRIPAIAGVLSGSLAWLFDQYDGQRPFSGYLRAARDAGYTEPDPRDDLSGEDVRRKLLVLARAAGTALEEREVDVESLLPGPLAALSLRQVDAALPMLDAPLRERHALAHARGEKLRFIARLELADDGATIARVGLESMAAAHPLAAGAGTDNRLAIWSDRYRGQPLLIQGPGAGAAVTAAALLDDVLRIAGHGR